MSANVPAGEARYLEQIAADRQAAIDARDQQAAKQAAEHAAHLAADRAAEAANDAARRASHAGPTNPFFDLMSGRMALHPRDLTVPGGLNGVAVSATPDGAPFVPPLLPGDAARNSQPLPPPAGEKP